MTSSLGVEVTPGRFRSLVTSARALVEARDADLLDSLASVGDQLGALLGDRVGTRVPARRGPPAGGRPPAGRAAHPGCRGQPARDRRSAPERGTAFVPGRRRGVHVRPRPRQPQDAHAAGRRAPGRGPAPLRDAWRWRGRLGRRHAAQRAAPPLPNRRRSRARGHALGRGHVGAHQRHHPAAHRRARRAPNVPDGRAQCGEPVRLPLPRAPLRRPSSARSSGGGGGGRTARGAVPVARGSGRAHPGALHQPARHRGGGHSLGARASLHRAVAGRSPQELVAREVRDGRKLLPVRHHGLLAGRGHPRPRHCRW